jgi:hypothetical protein
MREVAKARPALRAFRLKPGDVRLTPGGGVYLLLKELPAEEPELAHGFLTLALADDRQLGPGFGAVWEPASAWLERHTRPF